VISIEEEFDIQVTDEEAIELTSFQAAVRLIERKTAAL